MLVCHLHPGMQRRSQRLIVDVVETIGALMGDDMARCNICGGEEFVPGPGGRLCRGMPPGCAKCGSLERHRMIRCIYNTLKRYLPLREMKALQFSPEEGVPASAFGGYWVSVYEGVNSLDIQDIALPDGAVDMVICNHVLEHVERDADALAELMRITSPTGIMQLSVPSPMFKEKTEDWGYPDWDKYGHYRIYGRDVFQLFETALPGVNTLQVIQADPVTQSRDVFYFFSRGPLLGPLARALGEAVYVPAGAPDYSRRLNKAFA